jgi:hypothetical protein
MKAKVQNPRILLLSSSLEFQRTARFSSFDALLQQEKQHLQIVVNKIAALKPDVVVVEKTVSRLALEFLLKVTVAFELFSVVEHSHAMVPRAVCHTTGQHLARLECEAVAHATHFSLHQRRDPSLHRCAPSRPNLFLSPNASMALRCRLIAHAHYPCPLPTTEPDNVVVKSTTIGTCQNFRVALYKVRSVATIVFYRSCFIIILIFGDFKFLYMR